MGKGDACVVWVNVTRRCYAVPRPREEHRWTLNGQIAYGISMVIMTVSQSVDGDRSNGDITIPLQRGTILTLITWRYHYTFMP